MRVVIMVGGGLVQEVYADEKLDYIIIDQDIQDEDECHLIDTVGNQFTASINDYATGADQKTVEHYFNQIPPM